MKKFECRRTPVHILSTSDARAGSVELRRRQSQHQNVRAGSPGLENWTNKTSDQSLPEVPANHIKSEDAKESALQKLYNREALSQVLGNAQTALPHVLISLALEEEQFLDVDQCLRWLHQFPALAKYANVQGVYRSNSTLLVLSLPVLIWDWLPDDPACSFIGYVHSSNLLDSDRVNRGHSVPLKVRYEEALQPPIAMDCLASEAPLCSEYATDLSIAEESSSSTASSSSRSKSRFLARIATRRPLMPKGGSDDIFMSRDDSSQSMHQVDPTDKLLNKIDKTTYQQPKHDRVKCKMCGSQQEGFRSEHELQRHIDREHKTAAKLWICVEPTQPSHLKPTLPLSRCKACSHKKRYGAYYNAAAHLRRAHFKPKLKSKGKSGSKEDRAGGKGGGDWPAMSELKYWMKEIDAPVVDSQPAETHERDEDSDNEQTSQPGWAEGPFPSFASSADDGQFSLNLFTPPSFGGPSFGYMEHLQRTHPVSPPLINPLAIPSVYELNPSATTTFKLSAGDYQGHAHVMLDNEPLFYPHAGDPHVFE